jgi:hypothetical protein
VWCEFVVRIAKSRAIKVGSSGHNARHFFAALVPSTTTMRILVPKGTTATTQQPQPQPQPQQQQRIAIVSSTLPIATTTTTAYHHATPPVPTTPVIHTSSTNQDEGYNSDDERQRKPRQTVQVRPAMRQHHHNPLDLMQLMPLLYCV